MGIECFSNILILSQRQDIIQLLLDILNNKNIDIRISENVDDISTDYCLIIVGPDIDSNLVFKAIKELRGIIPYFLFLENQEYPKHPIYTSCKCKKIHLPMEILTIEEQLEELLEIHYG